MNRPVRIIACINERLGSGQKSCGGSGSRQLIKELRDLLDSHNLDSIGITEQVCLGRCMEGPIMRIAPGGEFFTQITADQLPSIVESVQEFIIKRESKNI